MSSKGHNILATAILIGALLIVCWLCSNHGVEAKKEFASAGALVGFAPEEDGRPQEHARRELIQRNLNADHRPDGLTAISVIEQIRLKSKLPFNIVAPSGKIYDRAAVAAGLSPEEIPLVQNDLDKLKKGMADLMASKLIELPASEGSA